MAKKTIEDLVGETKKAGTPSSEDDKSETQKIDVQGDYIVNHGHLAKIPKGDISNSYDSPYIQHAKDSRGNDHMDDSVTGQSHRRKTTKREKGENVDTKHMTPREFRKFSAGIWNGVEKSENAYNFTPHIWEVIEKPKDTDKRTVNRRVNKRGKHASNRRTKAQRDIDKLDLLVYRICFNFSVLTLFILGALVIIFDTHGGK